jgi:pimeloyl-ACP methyl ester carboxylesterase
MAQSLARAGIPVLRYDLPGTGDSSGDACDSGLLESWIHSVSRAAGELRNIGEIKDVAVVGIHLGAMLALRAASRGADIGQLVLWGPAARGRAVLRELRALANMERHEYLAHEAAPPQPIAGFETGGFLIAPETLRALEDLDISNSLQRWRGRVLLLSRDELPHDAALVESLWACPEATVEMAAGRGYSAMTASPQESVFPEDTCRRIAEFVGRDCDGSGNVAGEPAVDCVRTSESIYTDQTCSLGMFGILAEPEPDVPRSDCCLLYLNAGGVRHIGPNRMWVESARRWASRGVASLRFDLQGIGESDGEEYIDVPGLYKARLMDQIEAAIDSLRRYAGVRRFVAIGLCSGACWAFHAAMRNPDVRAAIAVNPSLLAWDPGADRRRMIRRVVAGGISGCADWTRMIRDGIQRGDIRQGLGRIAEAFSRTRTNGDGYLELGFETVPEAWGSLERRRKRVTLVFREGEPLLAEMEAFGHLPPDAHSFVRCVRIPNGGHTLRPLWAQKLVHDVIDSGLPDTIQAGLPADEFSCLGGAKR